MYKELRLGLIMLKIAKSEACQTLCTVTRGLVHLFDIVAHYLTVAMLC